jgi:hypothetical protein
VWCQCGRDIEYERAQAGLDRCMACAQRVQRVKGYMSYGHKTAPNVQVVSPEEFQTYRKYQPYGKYTGQGSGVHAMSRPIVKLG